MLKSKIIFVCNNCGNETPTWSGKCFSCGSWNSLKQFQDVKSKIRNLKSGTTTPQKLNTISLKNQERIKTGIFEFDRVVGGGIVPGSLILLAGEPGIGKSTLLESLASGLKRT